MQNYNIFMNTAGYKTVLLIISIVLSQFAIADNPITNTLVNQSDYEPLHQGQIQVSATLFNAPCNLSVDKTLSLTGCAAGKDYREMNLFNATAKTPVIVRFYDVQLRIFSECYPLSLLNGNNAIHLPTLMDDRHAFRLEVSYE